MCRVKISQQTYFEYFRGYLYFAQQAKCHAHRSMSFLNWFASPQLILSDTDEELWSIH